MTLMFHLASQSPRRRELLAAAGYRFQPLSVTVEEQPAERESGHDYIRRVVDDKRRAAQAVLPPEATVLVADTEVLLDDRPLGKPADLADAAATLRQLSGRRHAVISRVAVARGDRQATAESLTHIDFDTLTDADIERYCATGEPLGKAGSYAVQGAAAAFIRRIDGSLTGVIGLPIAETRALLADFGIHPAP